MNEAVVLVGGLGTRLQGVVADRPKPLAPVDGVPFLRFVLDSLDRLGMIRRVVFTLGHQGEQIEAFVRRDAGRWHFTSAFTREPELLGTGGGLRLALEAIEDEAPLVLNGDSFLDFDAGRLEAPLRDPGIRAALAVRRVPNVARYGAVALAPSGDPAWERAVRWEEKGGSGEGWVNGGICRVRRRDFLDATPPGRAFSLESDVLAPWCLEGRVGAVRAEGAAFLDIGEPAAYAAAGAFFASLGRGTRG